MAVSKGDNSAGALSGLRVLDLSPDRVGAQVSQTLADFGGEVVWVEPPGGSRLREQPSFPFLARGKHSLVADLGTRDGVERVRALAAQADVLIESFRPGVAERLGLGFEELSTGNEGLVYASITGFGRQGPYAHLKGYEGLVAAKLGVNAVFAKLHTGAHPPFVSTPWCSFGATQTALHGILAALLERQRSGLGQRVEASLAQGFAALDTWAWFLHIVAQRWPDAFVPTTAFSENDIPNSPFPYMLLVAPTRDGRWLQFAQVAPRLFAALMKALGLDWMFTDPEWKGIPVFEDAERRLGLWTRMLEAANQKTLAEWQAVFDADHDVFAELYRKGPEVLDHPQLVHDGVIVDIADPERGPVRQPGPLVHMSETPAVVERPAPALDQHDIDGWIPAAPAPAPTAHSASGLPLEGITVLELAVMFAAPFGATLLTDLGARVIKVEPLDGDPIRNIVAFPEAGGAKVMQGKQSIAVDLATPEGVAIVHELAARSDAVLEGFRAGVAERLHIDADTLRTLNPDLIYLSSPGYGIGGPQGDRPAFAPSIGAAGGIAATNIGDTVPERPGLSIEEIRGGSVRLSGAATALNAQADGFAALGVATSLLLGLLARERGGGGQRLLSSMLLTTAHAMADHVIDFPGNPGGPAPGPDMRGSAARYRIYDAADGWVFLAAPQPHEWDGVAAALAPYVDLRSDLRFATEDDRRVNDAALGDVLASAFASRGKDEWERDLTAADVGCVAVTTEPMESLMMSAGFGRASGYVADTTHPTFRDHPRLAPYVRFSRSTTQAKGGVLCGEQTDAVLSELGYSDAQIADLRARKIVA